MFPSHDSPAPSVLLNILLLCVAWYGLSLVGYGQLPFNELAAFVLYGAIVAVSFSFLVSAYTELLQGIGGLKRVFELIDGLKATTKLAEKNSNLKKVNYIGIETNKILAVGAKRLHENEDVRIINSIKKCPKIDILYDRAVSSYAFTKVSQLVALLRKSKVGILNLFLSKKKSFIKLNKLGKKVTYFSQKKLLKKVYLKKLMKLLHYTKTKKIFYYHYSTRSRNNSCCILSKTSYYSTFRF